VEARLVLFNHILSDPSLKDEELYELFQRDGRAASVILGCIL
jgi:hypothetical protein